MRSLRESRERWKIFFETYNSTSALKHDVLKKQHNSPPGDIGLRSLCWKLFLLFPAFQTATWPPHIYSSRTAYSDLCKKFLSPFQDPSPLEGSEKTIDPLADDDSNPWSELRKDEELRKEILLDVERCMPDVAYFRTLEVQKQLLDILFIYCKLNQDVSYRQGMHEIAATILWVVDNDAVVVEDGGIASMSEDDTYMLEALNPSFVEHDTFSLFQAIMRSAKAWYELGNERKGPEGTETRKGNSPIIEKSRVIHDTYLTAIDPELATHLKELDVLPQVFLIRWIRLLFGREFPFSQLLVLWDCLFAEDPSFILVDFVCIAMLLRVRWQLIEADYSTAITLLLRYPAPQPPHLPASFVPDAIYLRSNMTLAGGSHIIQKYSDRAPLLLSSTKSPFGSLRGPRVRPLSPVTFLGNQVGLEGLVQDVARGVLDRGEKWGVNKAVRDVMGEVRKNVEAMRIDPPVNSSATMENRVIELKRRLKQQEERQKTLASILSVSLDELATLKAEPSSEYIAQRIDGLLITINHIRDCLLDKSLEPNEKLIVKQPAGSPLPTSLSSLPSSKPSTPLSNQSTIQTSNSMRVSQAPPPPSPLTLSPISNTPPQHSHKLASTQGSQPPSPAPPPAGIFPKTTFRSSTPFSNSPVNKSPNSPSAHHRARSSLAQSNFAWMLGEDPLAIRNKGAFGGIDGLFVDNSGSALRSKMNNFDKDDGEPEDDEIDLFGVGPGGKTRTRRWGSADDKSMGSVWEPASEEGLDLGSL